MKIKLLAILCVLAILAGTLGMTAAAEIQTSTDFQAGLAVVDINPYWSIYSGERKPSTMQDGDIMPLPMAGYGDNTHRLSDATLYDDNGDGQVSGPAGDGLHATVLAIQSEGKTVLLITADLISIKLALTNKIRAAIEEKTGVPAGNITVSGTHTHNGVDVTVTFKESGEPFTSADGETDYTAAECQAYLDCYNAYLVEQLAEGAQVAVDDLTPATMEKGTIDLLTYNDGRIMNNVRHYKQVFQDWESWLKKRTVTYVRGSSFNNDADGNGSYDSYYNYAKSSYWSTGSFAAANGEAESVSDGDHNMHILQFKFANGKDPIALVNWRGHPASANKLADGLDVYQKLGGDYISSTRYALDSYGYRTAFILGASGNLGVNSSIPSLTWLGTAASEAGKATTVLYGEILAAAANDLMTGTDTTNSIVTAMHQIEAGPILTSRLKYKYELNVPSELEAAAAAAAKAAYAAGTDDSRFSYVYTDSNSGESFVIASYYHANSAVNRSAYTAGQKASMELNVITVGEELAFLALPYEASDRYSMDATMDTANDYNDWDALATVRNFGTPFVITCANDHKGYIPNHLAYNYNSDATPAYKYAIGSYESQTSYIKDGEGEKLLETFRTMLDQMESKTGQCQYCDETVVWEPLTEALLSNNSHSIPTGHYYLHEDLEYTANQVSVKDGNQVCLDLNGNTYSVNHPEYASRAIAMSGGSRLNIQDSSENETGVMMGHGVLVETAATGFSTGTLRVGHGCEVNFYSGTLTQDTSEAFHATAGGVVGVVGSGVFNMYGGTITGGKSSLTSHGGNVYLSAYSEKDENDVVTGTYYSTFNMYDGLITGGTAGGKGGNIFAESGCSFNMYGGELVAGTAATGNNIYSYGNVTLGGAANAGEIVFATVPAAKLRVDGTYTGTANVVMPTDGLTTGTDVGNALNSANIDDATLTVADCDIPVKVVGSELILVRDGAPATVDEAGNMTYYDGLLEAMTAYEATGSAAVKLMLNEDASGLTIDEPARDVYLDLNGCTLSSLTAYGDNKVYISDTATDDYTVDDGSGNDTAFGTVPATANVVAAPDYIKIVEDGNASFHKVERRLTSVNLRAGNVGIYYGSRFAGDEKVAGQVSEYGVALQVGSAPTPESIAADTLHKTHAGAAGTTWQAGSQGNGGYGVLLKDIMKPDNGYAFNKRNANYKIYGVAYMQMKDGTIVVSEEVQFTLKEVVEKVDLQFSKLSTNQRSTVVAMYKKYTQVMGQWEVPNMKAYVEANG